MLSNAPLSADGERVKPLHVDTMNPAMLLGMVLLILLWAAIS